MLLIFRNPTDNLTKSFIAAHQRRLKNGQVVQVAAYSDKRLRKDARTVHVDHGGIKAEDKEQWARLHQEQHVLHHTDKAAHERRIKEADGNMAHHRAKAAHHEGQRDIARKNGDKDALSHHNKMLAHHHNRAQDWTNRRSAHERHLAKVNHKLEGIKAAKEALWAGSGEVSERSTDKMSFEEFKDYYAPKAKEKKYGYEVFATKNTPAGAWERVTFPNTSATIATNGIHSRVTPSMAVKMSYDMAIKHGFESLDKKDIKTPDSDSNKAKNADGKASGQSQLTQDAIALSKLPFEEFAKKVKGAKHPIKNKFGMPIRTPTARGGEGSYQYSYSADVQVDEGYLSVSESWLGNDSIKRVKKKLYEQVKNYADNLSTDTDEKASAKNPTGKEAEPHMMTFSEFSKTAKAVKLENHGRKWEVFSGNKSLGFADDKTPDEAIRTAHKRAVNNALYSRSKHNSGIIPVAEMPPKNVLSEYPDVVDKFPGVVGMASPKITPTGKENEVKTAKGTKVNTRFAVVEAHGLTTSHDGNGNPNPNYPSELQPRNRERGTSQAQIARIAKNLDPDMLGRTRNASNGAPIVGDDGVVESGNGRTMAINQAYKTGNADDYREWLEDIADTYGLDAKQIKGMTNPVLVRVRTSDIDRAQFAREANQSDMLAMTATEKAKSDSNHLTDAVIGKLSVDGDLSAASNRDFVMAFMAKLGDDESAGLLTTSGQPTKQLYDRAQSAIFAKAYNDDRLLELMADTDKPEIANIIKSLNQAAPSFITARSISEHHAQATTDKLVDAVDVSLDKKAVDSIVKAVEMLKKAKDSGMHIEEFVKQNDLFGNIDPVVAQMALFIKDNNRSPARMGEAFKAMAGFLVKELTARQNASLFDDEKPVNMADVIKAANDHLQKQYGEQARTIGASTGGFIDIFTETRGQKADREKFLSKSFFFIRKSSPLFKAYISGHYRKLKSGKSIFIPAHHDKRHPHHDTPLNMSFEQWRDTEIDKHLKQLKAHGKSTVSVREFLEKHHYTQDRYDHHIKQLERAKSGQAVENIKHKEPEKLFHRKKKPLAAHDAPQNESPAETPETDGKQAFSDGVSIAQPEGNTIEPISHNVEPDRPKERAKISDFKVVKKNRKYFEISHNGYKAKLLINESSKDLEVGSHSMPLVDISVRTKYGTEVIYKLPEKYEQKNSAPSIVTLSAPYNENMVAEARKLGGKWDGDSKAWVFPDLVADEVEALDEKYNSKLIPVEITFNNRGWAGGSGYNIAGVPIARASGRDSGAKMSHGVSVIRGGASSGGSVKNWATTISSGTVIRMMMPEALLADVDDPDIVIERIGEFKEEKPIAATKTYLNVPYEDKDTAKRHGAKWDGDMRQWYVVGDVPNRLEKFMKAFPGMMFFFRKAA